MLVDGRLDLPDEAFCWDGGAELPAHPVGVPAWGKRLVDTIAAFVELAVGGPVKLYESRLVFLTPAETSGIAEHVDEGPPGAVTALVYFTPWEPGDGGELVVDGELVEPIPCRLVAFPSTTPHAVRPFVGVGFRGSWRLVFEPA